MTEGDARSGSIGCDLGPEDAQALLRAWLDAVDLRMSERDLLALLQSDGFSHAGLERRARRVHERRLESAVTRAIQDPSQFASAAQDIFTACFAAIPYAPAAAFLGREKGKLTTRDHEPIRVALVADGIGGMHGVTHTIDEIRERGVPGFEVEVIGTDPHVDRRLSAVAEVEIPYYAGLKVGVPSLPATVDALAEGRYELLHVCAPGPAGVAAAMIGRVMGLPLAGSYHTELAAYAAMRSGNAGLATTVDMVLGAFYGSCDVVLSPSAASDARLASLGIEQVSRWDRGVDTDRFSRALRTREPDGRVRVLYAGRLTREKGADLLADAFLAARARDPRLELVPGRRRTRGGRPARAARQRRPVSRLARRRGAGARIRGRRPLPLLLADGHLRPGGPRGAGLRAPGRRGGRGRPDGADRLRPHRRPVPAAGERDRRRRRRSRRVARGPRAARPRRAKPLPASAAGNRRWPRSPPDGSARFPRRRRG